MPVPHPVRDPFGLARWLRVAVHNAFHRVLTRRPPVPPAALPELDEVRQRARTPTDISDHLETLFVEALAARPTLIVELGVRGGESTFVLERVARLAGARVVGVDIDDCARVSTYKGWTFVKSDDVAFAAEFPAWCAERRIGPKVDFLFLDTSHVYEHTVREIAAWFPHLSDRARVAFHDTNQQGVYRRRDGSRGHGWPNDRGVIRALEEHLGTVYDERRDFVDVRKGWIVRHHAVCNGFTVLERAP